MPNATIVKMRRPGPTKNSVLIKPVEFERPGLYFADAMFTIPFSLFSSMRQASSVGEWKPFQRAGTRRAVRGILPRDLGEANGISQAKGTPGN